MTVIVQLETQRHSMNMSRLLHHKGALFHFNLAVPHVGMHPSMKLSLDLCKVQRVVRSLTGSMDHLTSEGLMAQ